MASSESSLLFHWHLASSRDTPSLQLDNKQSAFLIVIAISLTVLVTTFVLHGHWVCRYRQFPVVRPPTVPQSPPLSGLDSTVLSSLPIITVSPSMANYNGVVEGDCAICLGVFEEKGEIKVLPECNRAHHSECVDKWPANQSSLFPL